MLNASQLRAMEVNDLQQIWAWRNSERIRNAMIGNHVISWEEHCHWFDKQQRDETSTYFVYEQEGRPVGVVNFTHIHREHLTCYWGFYLGEDGLPKGTGTMMGKLALQYAFEHLGIRKVCAEVLGDNIASKNFHIKLGFRQEGVLKEHIWKKGAFIDLVCFALFRDDYLKEARMLD